VSPITATVTGAAEVTVAITRTVDTQRRLVWAAIEGAGVKLEANVKSDWLSGRALHRQSGRLASSVNTRFRSNDRSATSNTGTNVVYGAAWELGFMRNDLGARAGYARRQKSRDVYGRVSLDVARVSKSGKIITTRRAKTAQGVAFVSNRLRKVGAEKWQPARPFLRPALEELRPSILRDIRNALEEGKGGFGSGPERG
jgi:hypothetical protein